MPVQGQERKTLLQKLRQRGISKAASEYWSVPVTGQASRVQMNGNMLVRRTLDGIVASWQGHQSALSNNDDESPLPGMLSWTVLTRCSRLADNPRTHEATITALRNPEFPLWR